MLVPLAYAGGADFQREKRDAHFERGVRVSFFRGLAQSAFFGFLDRFCASDPYLEACIMDQIWSLQELLAH